MNGLAVVQNIYARLRRPSDKALPYQDILRVMAGVIKRKKLDLALSEQGQTSQMSEWFAPDGTDFDLSSQSAELKNIMLPLRVEMRDINATDDLPGIDIPIVNYLVLQETPVFACAFYGSPIRMVFSRPATGYWGAGDIDDWLGSVAFRVAFEPDFGDAVGLSNPVQLPEYFSEMITELSLFKLLGLVQDDTPSWASFKAEARADLQPSILDWEMIWKKFVTNCHGRTRVFKKTIFNHRGTRRGIYFDPYREL